MAASWNWPLPSNAILSDVDAINQLINAAARWDPAYNGITDVKSGMKRLASVTGGQQFQNFNGSAWATVGKLMHDVDTLDGYHASTTAQKDSIPVYNASALLPGGITGNAATATKLKTARALQVGGIASGAAVNFDGSAPVTLNVDSITLNNDEDDAVNGVLTTAHGGTGRTDGAAQDVRVSSLVGEVSAKEYGQIGQSAILTSEHIDSIVVAGKYRVASAIGMDLGAPKNHSGFALLEVSEVGSWVFQKWTDSDGASFVRRSGNSGSSWSGWMSGGGTSSSSLRVYVSKSGSDSNSGLSASHPVLTIAKAIRIAKGHFPGDSDARVYLHLGEGNWGNVVFRFLPFWLSVCPYDGLEPEEFSESLPRFGSVTVYGGNVDFVGLVADALFGFYSAAISIGTGYKRIGAVVSRFGAMVIFESSSSKNSVWEIHSQTVVLDYLLAAFDAGTIYLHYQTIRFVDNISATNFIFADRGGRILTYKGRTVFEPGEFLFTGQKARFRSGAVFYSQETGGAVSILDGFPGTSITIENGAVINGYVMGQAVQADVDAAINALDAAMVKLTGDQTIAGIKTFTSRLRVSSINPQINMLDTDIERGLEPSALNESFPLVYMDKNAVRLAGFYCQYTLDRTVTSELIAYKGQAGGSTNARVGVVYPPEGAPYGKAPATPAGSTGTEIVTAGYLASTDSGVVHITGDETVRGAKTFTSNLAIQKNSVTKGTPPTSNTYWNLNFTDKNGEPLGFLQSQYASNGQVLTKISAINLVEGESVSASVEVVVNSNGSSYGTAPTPAAESNANHIATTAWVRDTLGAVNWGGLKSRTVDTWYTEEGHGILRLRMSLSSGSNTCYFHYKDDAGTEKSIAVMSSYANSANNGTTTLPIEAGREWKVTVTGGSVNMSFIPYK